MKAISPSEATSLALIAANPTPERVQAFSVGMSHEAREIADAMVGTTLGTASNTARATAKAIKQWAAANRGKV